MKGLFKNIGWYFLGSLILVILTLVYQKVTGPTYDKGTDVVLLGKEYDFDIPRSAENLEDTEIKIEIPNSSITGAIFYKRYPTNDDYTSVKLRRQGKFLVGKLPKQPEAGKLQYFIEFYDGNKYHYVHRDDPVIIRYKGHVPLWILRTHIFFMFASMLLSNMSGLLALKRDSRFKIYGLATLICLFIGGMILGPIVQKFAFGLYWSGVPFGWDLTDNKLLLSFLVWLVAVLGNIKKTRYYLAIAATILLILMYAIPHSTMGSEYDYKNEKVVTGD